MLFIAQPFKGFSISKIDQPFNQQIIDRNYI